MTNSSDTASLPTYEVYAIQYAERGGRRPDHFISGDPHDEPMPMAYYVWLIRSVQRLFVVDTGFGASAAAKRGRTLLRTPEAGLALLDVNVAQVKDVILTHLHYDHAGTADAFSAAQFHVQDDEMAYATGRYMRHRLLNHGYDVDDVTCLVRMVFDGRVSFYSGDAHLAPGITVHRTGGHTNGLQCVRVHTKRGWVMLASDTSHYYEHFEKNRVFRTVFNVGDALEGYRTLLSLADSPRHVVPGHDPLVMQRYPAPDRALEGIAVRLDVAPSGS